MKYITIDVLENGNMKHKDWIANAVCESEFSNLIKYIVEKETDHFLNHNQPERSKREDLEKIFPNKKCLYCKKGIWESFHQECGALNSMET